MLKQNLVDCEGWDLFAVLKGQHRRVVSDPLRTAGTSVRRDSRKRKQRRKTSRILTDSGAELRVSQQDQEDGLSRSERGRRKIARCLADGKPRAAWAELQRQQHLSPKFRLERKTLSKLALGLVKHEQWSEAVGLLEEYVERFDEQADPARVQLATIYLERQKRPQAALKTLSGVSRERLPAKLSPKVQDIEQEAKKLIDSGVLELSDRAFSTE